MNRIPIILFLVLLSILTAIIFSGTLLGMLNAYTPVSVLSLTVLMFALTLFVSFRFIRGFFETEERSFIGPRTKRTLNWSGYAAGTLLFIVLLFLPLALWPLSSINSELAWDAGVYHLPRAAELVVSHSMLDLSISYGEYPAGYETLIAFSLLLNRDGYLIGLTHAVIMGFFVLAAFLLCRRFSSLPGGVLFFIVVFVFSSYDLVRFIESNPFSWIRLAGFTIGKNDFLIAAAIIALLAFSPFGLKGQQRTFSLAGIALSSFLIAATKPNGILVMVVLLTMAVIVDARILLEKEAGKALLLRRWAAVGLLLLFGFSWAIRNLLLNRALFSQSVLEIREYSIINNLANPYFYHHMGIYLHVTLALFLLSVIAAIFYRKIHWTIPFVFFVLLLSFAITPSTAFWGSTHQPAEVAWRFGVYLLVFLLPVLLLFLEPPVEFFLKKMPVMTTVLIVAAMGVTAAAGTVSNLDRLKADSQNLIVLRDQYRESVGTGGYFSAYDYIRKNVSHSVVWVENGMPLYVFGEGLTNSISRRTAPDYWVFLQTAWINKGGYPGNLDTDEFRAGWELVYQDSEGRVYKNRALQ